MAAKTIAQSPVKSHMIKIWLQKNYNFSTLTKVGTINLPIETTLASIQINTLKDLLD